jgi:hypothetical protein
VSTGMSTWGSLCCNYSVKVYVRQQGTDGVGWTPHYLVSDWQGV